MASNPTWEATGTSLRLSAELGVGDTRGPCPQPNAAFGGGEGEPNTLQGERPVVAPLDKGAGK